MSVIDELIKVAREWNPYTAEVAEEAAAELAKLHAHNYKMEVALKAISSWTKAYPLSVFPEPDFGRVRELLEAGGITLDSVSASNMRHVIEGVVKLVHDGLFEETNGG